MNSFSSDTDILKYEPMLFGDLDFVGQAAARGNSASISNSTLNAADADFISAQIVEGMVVYLRSENGEIEGAFEIASVDSATQLKISVLRADSQSDVITVPNAENVSYKICTYKAQGREILLQLSQHFGLRPGVADGQYSVDDILDASVLKQVSVYGILSIVYAALAGRADDNNYWKKSNYYRQLYEKAIQRCKVSIDLGDDGAADAVRSGGSIRLLRD